MACTEDDIEDLQLQIEELLLVETVETLSELAEGLNIDENHWKNKRKIQILNALRKYIDGKVEDAPELISKKDF